MPRRSTDQARGNSRASRLRRRTLPGGTGFGAFFVRLAAIRRSAERYGWRNKLGASRPRPRCDLRERAQEWRPSAAPDRHHQQSEYARMDRALPGELRGRPPRQLRRAFRFRHARGSRAYARAARAPTPSLRAGAHDRFFRRRLSFDLDLPGRIHGGVHPGARAGFGCAAHVEALPVGSAHIVDGLPGRRALEARSLGDGGGAQCTLSLARTARGRRASLRRRDSRRAACGSHRPHRRRAVANPRRKLGRGRIEGRSRFRSS